MLDTTLAVVLSVMLVLVLQLEGQFSIFLGAYLFLV